jgi:hypothetical protein
VFPRRRPPHPCECGFILSSASPPLQSAGRPDPARRPKSARHHVVGFVPHRSINTQSPLVDRAPKPGLAFRPRRFSRPRRFAPPRALQAYFIPQPRPGFTLQGFLFATQQRHLIDDALPSCRSRQTPAADCSTAPASDTRLQGFAPSSDSKPLGEWLNSPNFDPLLCFHSLGFFSARLGTAFTAPPLTTFAGEYSLCTLPLAPSVSISARPDDPSLDHPPVRDFQPGFPADRSRPFHRGPTRGTSDHMASA